MHFLGYILLTFARVFGFLINIYTFIVAIAVIISWVRPDPYNPIVVFLRQATEPALRIARRFVPRTLIYRTGIDFSPILLFIFLIVLDTLCVGMLSDLARSLLVR